MGYTAATNPNTSIENQGDLVITASFASADELLAGFRRVLGQPQDAVLRSTVQTDPVLDFAHGVARGLSQDPPSLDPRFLYDDQGSELYARICQQPEYYPPRVESRILRTHARLLPALTGEATLFELGSGNAEKTGHLLAAYQAAFGDATYVPIDVSDAALLQAEASIGERFPDVRFIGVNGTFQDGFPLFRVASPALVVFLGSTIGNLPPAEAARFWEGVADALAPGDHFLLGVDLVKEPAFLERAYDDCAGVTASFTRNLFGRMNRELGAAVDLQAVEHVARWSDDHEQVEIHAHFTAPQVVEIEPLDRRFEFDAGDRVLVEVSRKFRIETLPLYLGEFGFELREVFTDERGWFAHLLLQRSPVAGFGDG